MKRYRAPFMLIPCFLIMLILTAGCSAVGKPNIKASDVDTKGHRGKDDSGEEKKAKFDKVKMQETPVSVSMSLSPDNRTANLLFAYLEAILDTKDKGIRAKTNTTTFIIPVKDNDKELHVKLSIRGVVFLDQGARAVLLAQIGGKTVLVDLPQPSSSFEDVDHSFETTLPPGQDCLVTLFLLVERDSDAKKMDANLTVEELEIIME